MTRLRETIDTDDRLRAVEGSTKFETERNRHPLHCGMCGGIYYVGEDIYRRVLSAQEGDLSENPFYCDDCKEEYMEESRSH